MSTYHKMMNAEFSCPFGAQEKTNYWSQSGFSRFCQKGTTKHGRWTAWEKGEKVIDGTYKENRYHGKWLFFKDNLNYKIIEYKDGIEVKSYLIKNSKNYP